MSLVLDIRFESIDAPVGSLVRLDSSATAFVYAPEYLSLPDPIPVSQSLSLRQPPFADYETRAFFANLLPENDQLQHVIDRERLDRDDFVGLLFHLGADCPGAVSCLPVGSAPTKVPGSLATDYDFLAGEEIDEIVRRLADREPLPEAVRDPSPVAGVQRKIALTYAPDGRFAVPKRGLRVPTTHILKVPRRADAREAELETATALLAQAAGLNVAIPQVAKFGETTALLVPRFDRRFEAGRISRIHQEDFAQALGLPSSLKYERAGANAFSIAAIAKVIATCATPARAAEEFLKSVFFNLAVGNTDNHAKNHALLYDEGANPNLAPLYDLLPIKLNPRYSTDFAFRIGGAERAEDLTIKDFARLFTTFGLGPSAGDRFVRQTIAPLLKRLDRALDDLPPGMKDFADLVGGEMRRSVGLLGMDLDLKPRDLFAARAGGWAAS